MTATRPGKALAEKRQAKRHSEALHTAMERLIEAAASHAPPKLPNPYKLRAPFSSGNGQDTALTG